MDVAVEIRDKKIIILCLLMHLVPVNKASQYLVDSVATVAQTGGAGRGLRP